jgi:hypothetical protein
MLAEPCRSILAESSRWISKYEVANTRTDHHSKIISMWVSALLGLDPPSPEPAKRAFRFRCRSTPDCRDRRRTTRTSSPGLARSGRRLRMRLVLGGCQPAGQAS